MDYLGSVLKAARGNETQVSFAIKLGTKQSSVSRYEKGAVTPPRKYVDQCMHILHIKNISSNSSPTIEELVNQIQKLLVGDDYAQARSALSQIIHLISTVK